jgi:L-fuculose-phosphate aldolase
MENICLDLEGVDRVAEERQLRLDIVEVGRRLWDRGYVAANDGNISVRLGPDEFLATPTGVSKGFMTPEMLIVVNGRGELRRGTLQPSSEIKMHLRVYHDRADVQAVVHAHPPIATAFAASHQALTKPALPEVVVALGEIPLAPYATPSTDEVADSIVPLLPGHDVMLLANHGALALGPELYAAYYNMERIEQVAKITLAARQLGGEVELTPDQIVALLEVRRKLGLKVPGTAK